MRILIIFALLAVAYCNTNGGIPTRERDFIVVGVGTVGSVICGRLTQAGADVICLEAGGDWEYNTTTKTRTQWGSYNYFADPDPNRGGYNTLLIGGKGVGGSMYLTNNGWEQGRKYWWDNFYQTVQDSRYTYEMSQCFFDKIITKPYLSNTGKIQIRQSNSNTVLGNVWRQVGATYGLNTSPDCNDPSTAVNEFCFEPSSTRWAEGNSQGVGSRDTSWAEYVRPLLNKTRNEVWLGAKVTKLLSCETCSDNEIYGVEAVVNGTTYQFRAKYGVILSAGSLNNPEILQLSGIGDKALLDNIGVRTKENIPVVGEYLQDGGSTTMTFSTNIPFSHFAAGSTSLTNTKIAALLSTQYANPGEPDVLFLGVIFPVGSGSNIIGLAFNLASQARGTEYLVTKDPLTATSAKFSYLQSNTDLNRFVAFYNLTRELLGKVASIGGYTITETGPSVGKYSQAELQALARSIPENGGITNVNHWSGTVRMGPSAFVEGLSKTGERGASSSEYAIDPDFRPRGTKHLYVADASVFPRYPGEGGIAPSLFLGELLSQQLTKRYYNNALGKIYGQCDL